MQQHPQCNQLRSILVHELTRRRLVAGMGCAAAALGLATPALAAQIATPPATPASAADQARVNELVALSRTLCGGGDFDRGQAATLLNLLSSDTDLRRGLDELLARQPLTPAPATATAETNATPIAGPSSQARAATEAILLFWYVGYFQGQPIPNRAAGYDQFLAWQAMYTAPWGECKVYGAWADPPATAPQVPAT